MPRPFLCLRAPVVSLLALARSPFTERECDMSAITAGPDIAVATDAVTADAAADAPKRRGIVFWVVRYLPAEIVGTAAMVMAGLAVTIWTDSARPHRARRAHRRDHRLLRGARDHDLRRAVRGRTDRRRAVGRTVHAAARRVRRRPSCSTPCSIRPAALTLGVWLLPDPLWGLLAGKMSPTSSSTRSPPAPSPSPPRPACATAAALGQA